MMYFSRVRSAVGVRLSAVVVCAVLVAGPSACGEQPVPGGTATSPVNRPWPTAYPDSD